MLEVLNYLLVGGAMGFIGNIMGISWEYILVGGAISPS
jgi:hypothetical protein